MLVRVAASLILLTACETEEKVSKRGSTCHAAVSDPSEGASEQENLQLYAYKGAAWPLKDGAYTVSVCWKSIELGKQTFAVAAFAPDVDASVTRAKLWTREVVEQEWNAKTNIRFVGWHDCAQAPADISIVPISSAFEADDYAPGTSFVDDYGVFSKGKNLHLNVLFGDEFLYSSRYNASVNAETYDKAKDVAYFVPGTRACVSKTERDSLMPAWYPNSPGPNKVRIDEPEEMTRYMGLYKRCFQFNALHEFGHLAGFLHEHTRSDDTAEAIACRESIPADYNKIFAANRDNLPLGAYDLQSVMNYCRTDNSPTLSAGDIAMAAQFYPTKPGVKKSSSASSNKSGC